MKKRSSKVSAANLFQVALRQQGFFTAKQAKTAGYSDAVHGYHIANGDWERHFRGIYRLKMFPPVAWPHLMVWSLWSRGRDDKPVAVFSHDTARCLNQGLPVPEDKVHITVPPTFRKGAAIPSQLVIHKALLKPDEIAEEQGIQFTAPSRTQKDLTPEKPRTPSPGTYSRTESAQESPGGWAAWE